MGEKDRSIDDLSAELQTEKNNNMRNADKIEELSNTNKSLAE